MWNVLSVKPVLAVLSLVLLLVVSYVGFRVVEYLRGATSKDDTNADDLVHNFEEMRREGDINEAEFRTIQAVLGRSRDSNLNSNRSSSPSGEG
jgi:uncharacterized membrane protein